MVKQCWICKKTKFVHPDLTFHSLPVDNDTRAIWLSKLRGKHQEESIPKKATICSTHFKIEDFSIKPNGKKYLRSEALPLFYGDGNVESEPQSGPLSIENSSSQKNVLIIEINNEVASVLDCSKGDSSATETAPFSPSDTLTASEFELYSPPPFSLCEESTAMPENNEDENIKVKEEVEETEDKSNMDIPSQIFNDSREEVNDIEDKENEELPSQMFNKSRLKVIRYFGDIEIDDLEYPETRETCFNIINKTINKQKQKIKNLEAKNRRLVDKMYSMKSVTDHVIKTNANKQIPINISRASSEESEADINLWGYEDLKGCAEQIHDNMARLQEKLDEVVLLMKQKFPKLPIPNLRVRTAFYRKRQRREERFGASAAPTSCSDPQENTSWDESDEDFSNGEVGFCKKKKCDGKVAATKSKVGQRTRKVSRNARKTKSVQGLQLHPS